MSTFRIIRTSKRGNAVLAGIIVMMMVSMFGLAYITFTSTNLMRAERDERRTTAFYLAESGMEYVISKMVDALTLNPGTLPTGSYTSEVNTVVNSLRSGATGTGVASSAGSMTATVITSATYRGITERVRVRVIFKNVGVWNNAIFAGIGQSGRGINGNVDIRGSVHILGEGDPYSDTNGNGHWDPAEPFTDLNGNGVFDPGIGETFTDTDGNGVWTSAEPYQDNNLNGQYDPPLTATELATDMGGNANIGNNYNGIPAGLSSKIPVLPTVLYKGENVQSLNAELRVKHGKVNISGSAVVGSAQIAGNGVKETVDCCYVTNGYGGTKGASGVNSDNGTTHGYDLGDRVKFPGLFDPYKDPATGIEYATYENYLDSNSLVITESIIKSGTPSFSHSDGSGNSIAWDDITKTITLSGIVRIDGNLDMSSKGSTIYFSGRGTIFSKGTVKVHGSVMPKTMFPTTDSMGCVAKYDIEFATGSGESQLSGAGAWYAQRKMVSAKQNQFAGTYVADYFDMGTNVPSIFQVPTLASNLPPGMPGQQGVFSAQVVSWRHL